MKATILFLSLIFSQPTVEIIDKWRQSSQKLILFKDNKAEMLEFKEKIDFIVYSEFFYFGKVESLIQSFKKVFPFKEITEDLSKFYESTKIIDSITSTTTSSKIKGIIDEFIYIFVDDTEKFLKGFGEIEFDMIKLDDEDFANKLAYFCKEIEARVKVFNDEAVKYRKKINEIINSSDLEATFDTFYEQTAQDKKYEMEYERILKLIETLNSKVFNEQLITLKDICDAKTQIKELNEKFQENLQKEINIYKSEFEFTSDYFLNMIKKLFLTQKERIQKLENLIQTQAAKIYDEEVESKYSKEIDLHVKELKTNALKIIDEISIMPESYFLNETYYDVQFRFLFIFSNIYLKEVFKDTKTKLRASAYRLGKLKDGLNSLHKKFDEKIEQIYYLDEFFYEKIKRIFTRKVEIMADEIQPSESKRFFVFFKENEFKEIEEFLEKMERRIEAQMIQFRRRARNCFILGVFSFLICLCVLIGRCVKV